MVNRKLKGIVNNQQAGCKNLRKRHDMKSVKICGDNEDKFVEFSKVIADENL